MSAFKPAFKAFSYRRGDTPSLAIIFHGRNVLTQEIVRLPRALDQISWTIGWPGGAATKTTAPGGGLTVDPRTGAIAWPITEADIAALGQSVASFAVQMIESNGRRTTYLTGTIAAEG